jgi:hypothetical protein
VEATTLGILYVLPLVIWVIFLGIVWRVFASGSLEDSLAYLVILRSRRNRFVGFLALLAVSQIVKDSVQVVWGLGSASDPLMLAVSIVCNVVSALALVGLAWTLLTRGSLTPMEDRVLSNTAEALYAIGRPRDLPVEEPTRKA